MRRDPLLGEGRPYLIVMSLIQDFREDGFLDVGWRYAYADGVLGIWGVFLNLCGCFRLYGFVGWRSSGT